MKFTCRRLVGQYSRCHLQLLESIGAVEPSTKTKDIYQDIISAPVEPEFDDDAVIQEDDDVPEVSDATLTSAVRKVRCIFPAHRWPTFYFEAPSHCESSEVQPAATGLMEG